MKHIRQKIKDGIKKAVEGYFRSCASADQIDLNTAIHSIDSLMDYSYTDDIYQEDIRTQSVELVHVKVPSINQLVDQYVED